MPAAVLTVRQLNLYVRTLLEGDANLASVLVAGEISNFKNHYSSGHLYFSLKDADALVRAVMFRGNASRLQFRPEEGMRVICRGRVSLYEKDGQYQFYVEVMQPDGVGALAVAFEQRKQRLAAAGLFDEARKRPLPPFPSKIGVITSPTGAAVQDILQILGRRWPVAEILLVPVLVQGERAAADLTRALRTLSARDDVDLILIGRGGGSAEDLWAFNDEALAYAIAESPVPVVSAVGHETDFTICDFVADLRAPTPSAAAELASPDGAQLSAYFAETPARLSRLLQTRLTACRDRLTALRARRAFSAPGRLLEPQEQRLDGLTSRLADAISDGLRTREDALARSAAALDAFSPLRVLARGYAIAQQNGAVVRWAAEVLPDEDLTLRFSDGAVRCRVVDEKGQNCDA